MRLHKLISAGLPINIPPFEIVLPPRKAVRSSKQHRADRDDSRRVS